MSIANVRQVGAQQVGLQRVGGRSYVRRIGVGRKLKGEALSSCSRDTESRPETDSRALILLVRREAEIRK